ncbi:MAG: cation diffusion facilitator family transporter [Candidatus Aminicenantes bacterium]|nr:cation diffusion facilitator family transporter [Acidobacteriota bacterium]MCG2810037.1 cation diffusion facilitator family transporter [Candidatus Aminicenantes bacterium]
MEMKHEPMVNGFLPPETPDLGQREKKGQTVVNLGLIWNIILAAGKTAMGIAGHSTALLSDGINSTSDVAYYIVVKIFMKMAGRPPDPEHPYGHRQMESIAALTVGSFVITTAIAIFWTAINNVFDQLNGSADSSGATMGALWVALFTVVVKIFLTLYTSAIWKKTGSLAIKALAYDHRNDIFSALAASLGIFLARRGYPWVDPLAGALVALLILRTGIGILRQSTDDLMDSVPSHFLDRKIRSILENIPEIRSIEEIHAHRFGPYFVINLTIGIDGAMDVKNGDAIATRVEELLDAQIEMVRRVYVHYHPASM